MTSLEPFPVPPPDMRWKKRIVTVVVVLLVGAFLLAGSLLVVDENAYIQTRGTLRNLFNGK